MKKTVALSLLVLLVTAVAVAHQGHVHNILGTVKLLHENHLVITKTDGKEATVLLTDETTFMIGGRSATRADLVSGARVSVHLANDSKTAVTVKIAPRNTK